MSRRRAPRARRRRRSAPALERAAPETPLAAVQAAWAEAVGERDRRRREPVSERAGTVTVRCARPVWARSSS